MAKAKAAEAEAEVETGAVDFEGGEDGLVVDLSDVDEDGNFEVLPRGVYAAVVSNLTFGMSKASNNPMWSWEFEVADGEFAGRKQFYHTTFTEGGLPRVKKALARLAPEMLEKPFSPEDVAEEGALIGKECRIRVDVKPYEGRQSNNVRDVMAPESGDGFV